MLKRAEEIVTCQQCRKRIHRPYPQQEICERCRGKHIPTQEEIARVCAEIRAGWDKKVPKHDEDLATFRALRMPNVYRMSLPGKRG